SSSWASRSRSEPARSRSMAKAKARDKRMTATRWLSCADPNEMADHYSDRIGERKARLLMLACCRRHPEHLARRPLRAMVEYLTRHYADPTKPDKPFDSAEARRLYKSVERSASALALDHPGRGVAFGVVAAAEP